MAKYVMAVILACLIGSPFTGTASEAGKAPGATRLIGSFSPKTGVWSEYALFDKKTGKRTVMSMSIVGVERDSYWYELKIKEGEGSNIVKMMIANDPGDPENISRIIVKSGDKPARELDGDSVKKIRTKVSRMFEHQSGIPDSPDVNLKDIKTGEGVATVPAGTFDVSLHQIIDQAGRVYAEYKFSQAVRPFGIVTSETESATMVLVAHGSGAESLITEEPVMMSQPSGKLQEILDEIIPERTPPKEMGPGPGNNIRQIPGMGTGYESRQ